MRIHTKIVFDMRTGAILEDENYEYFGPVAECKGGGGGSTVNSVDYEYNDRMATLSEEQQEWAREYFQMWQQYYKPYEIAQAQANMELLPYETSLYKQQLQSASQLLPQQTEAAKQFLTSALEGVDVNERMGLATADAASAWKDVEATPAAPTAAWASIPIPAGIRGFRPRWIHRRPRRWPGQERRHAWVRNRKTLSARRRPLHSTQPAAFCKVWDS